MCPVVCRPPSPPRDPSSLHCPDALSLLSNRGRSQERAGYMGRPCFSAQDYSIPIGSSGLHKGEENNKMRLRRIFKANFKREHLDASLAQRPASCRRPRQIFPAVAALGSPMVAGLRPGDRVGPSVSTSSANGHPHHLCLLLLAPSRSPERTLSFQRECKCLCMCVCVHVPKVDAKNRSPSLSYVIH